MPNESTRIIVPFFQVLELRPGPEKIALTQRHLPFLFEEFISQGVRDLIVSDKKHVEWDNLPRLVRNHVFEARHQGRAGCQTFEIFKPIFEEFQIQNPSGLGFHYKHDPQRPRERDEAIKISIDASMQLEGFLTALHEKSLCQFNIVTMLARLDVLGGACRSPEARAHVSILRGIFLGYEDVSHAAVICKINSSETIIELFQELLEDAHYKALSHEASKFGRLQKLSTITSNITKLVKQIIQSRRSKGILDYGSRALSVATGIPVPTTEVAEALMRNAYFPPIVDFSSGIERATQKMITAYPDIRFVPF
jgi:hypothetical protein